MENDSVGGSHPAPQSSYGRACVNCSRIKGKCLYRDDPACCERCQRLGKHCQPSASSRKLGIKKSGGPKASHREEKLDQMVSVFHQQATIRETQQDPVLPGSRDAFPRGSDVSATQNLNNRSFGHISMEPFRSSFINQNGHFFIEDISAFVIPEKRAQEQLERFRQCNLTAFPFVFISEETSSSDLRSRRPFLWFVIMSLTTSSLDEQSAMGDAIRRVISQTVVGEHEKSLDLLLGLICYIAWVQFHKKTTSPLVMWTQLAVSLVFELGIHRMPPREDQFYKRVFLYMPQAEEPRTRTMEERRALLGTFIISAVTWTSLRRMEGLRWTAYMEDCASILGKGNDTELDILLMIQAKCHIAMCHVTVAHSEPAASDEDSTPVPVYFEKAMDLQLQNILQSIPTHLKTSRSMMLCFYATEVMVKEAVLRGPKAPEPRGEPDLQKLERLQSLLTSIERWFHLFFDLPLNDWAGTTFETYVQYSHFIVILVRLTILKEPGWDGNAVRNKIDVVGMLERIAQLVETLMSPMALDDAARAKEHAMVSAPRRIRAMIVDVTAELSTALLPADLQCIDSPTKGIYDSWGTDGTDFYYQEYPWLMEVMRVYPF